MSWNDVDTYNDALQKTPDPSTLPLWHNRVLHVLGVFSACSFYLGIKHLPQRDISRIYLMCVYIAVTRSTGYD